MPLDLVAACSMVRTAKFSLSTFFHRWLKVATTLVDHQTSWCVGGTSHGFHEVSKTHRWCPWRKAISVACYVGGKLAFCEERENIQKIFCLCIETLGNDEIMGAENQNSQKTKETRDFVGFLDSMIPSNTTSYPSWDSHQATESAGEKSTRKTTQIR